MAWLNLNAMVIQTIFIVISSVATAYYVYVSLGMLKEMKISRKKEEEPNVNLRLIKTNAMQYELEIKNISNVEVFDLKFLEYPHLNFKGRSTSEIGFLKYGISYLGVDQVLDNNFIYTITNNDKIQDEEEVYYLVFKMEYYDKYAKTLNRKKYIKEIQINLNFIANTSSRTATGEQQIDKLKEMNSHLENIAKTLAKDNEA